MANKWENNGNSERLYLGGSKITGDGDCSHEIERHLLLGRKAMTKLDSMLKSKDVTLQTKIMAPGPITSWEIDGEQWKQ